MLLNSRIRVPIAFLSNYDPIMHRFWDKAKYQSKLPNLCLGPFGGDPAVGIWPRSLATVNYSPCAIVWLCLRDPTFSSTPTCDRRTDGRTHDDSASVASRGNNDHTRCYVSSSLPDDVIGGEVAGYDCMLVVVDHARYSPSRRRLAGHQCYSS